MGPPTEWFLPSHSFPPPKWQLPCGCCCKNQYYRQTWQLVSAVCSTQNLHSPLFLEMEYTQIPSLTSQVELTLQFWRNRGCQCLLMGWLHRAREWSKQEDTPESPAWLTRACSGHLSPHLFRRGALPRPQHWPNSIPSKPIRLWGCFQTQEDQSMFRTEGTSSQFTANKTQATHHKTHMHTKHWEF